jgi:four helix bundle protein
MRDFKKLQIWQSGIHIVKAAYQLTNSLPMNEKFNLISQINRSAVSIPSNIAEGSSRKSEKDYYRFLEIALGSCFELETQILILCELGLSNQMLTNDIIDRIRIEQQQITSLMNKLHC